MQMRESKADQALAMEGICIIVSDIVRATAFLHQAVTSCNLNRTNVRLFQINRVSINTLSDLNNIVRRKPLKIDLIDLSIRAWKTCKRNKACANS